MKLYKSLEISIKKTKEKTSAVLFKLLSQDSVFLSWKHKKTIRNDVHTITIEITENEKDIRFDEIAEFSKLVKKNKKIITIYRSGKLSLKVNYEYDEQCNMEFHPKDLKKLVDNEIILCISCWKA